MTDENEFIQWKTLLDKASIDDETVQSLREEAKQLLRDQSNTTFPMTLLEIQYKHCSNYEWFPKFFDKELTLVLVNRVKLIDLETTRIEYYLNDLLLFKDFPLSTATFYVVLCVNESFENYCRDDTNGVFKNLLIQLLDTYINRKLGNGKFYHFITVVQVFDKRIPDIVHPIMAPYLSDRLDLNKYNADTVRTTLDVINMFDKIMKSQNFCFGRILELIRIKGLEMSCCKALKKAKDLIAKVGDGDTVATELFKELCECTVCDSGGLSDTAYSALSFQLTKVFKLPIDNWDTIITIIDPYAELVLKRKWHGTDHHYMPLLANYLNIKCCQSNLSQDKVKELDMFMLPVISDPFIQTHYDNRKSIPSIIAAFIQMQDIHETQCFSYGIQYCLDLLLNTINTIEADKNKFEFTRDILARGIGSILSEVFSQERAIKWLYTKDGDTIHTIFGKLLHGGNCQTPFPDEMIYASFRFVTDIIICDLWDRILMNKNESICEFIIRFILTVEYNLKFTVPYRDLLALSTRTLAIILCRTDMYLSAQDKLQISQTINLRNFYSLLLHYHSMEDNHYITVLLIQLSHLVTETDTKQGIQSFVVQSRTTQEEFDNLSAEDTIIIMKSYVDLLLDMKKHGHPLSRSDNFLPIFEDFFEYLDSEEWDTQLLMERYNQLCGQYQKVYRTRN
jgi:hypothetical protein